MIDFINQNKEASDLQNTVSFLKTVLTQGEGESLVT